MHLHYHTKPGYIVCVQNATKRGYVVDIESNTKCNVLNSVRKEKSPCREHSSLIVSIDYSSFYRGIFEL